MKAMTCSELGGACDLVFHAATFEEMAQMSQDHGRAMSAKGDMPHLQAMSGMSERMKSAGGMAEWMEDKRREFDARPHED